MQQQLWGFTAGSHQPFSLHVGRCSAVNMMDRGCERSFIRIRPVHAVGGVGVSSRAGLPKRTVGPPLKITMECTLKPSILNVRQHARTSAYKQITTIPVEPRAVPRGASAYLGRAPVHGSCHACLPRGMGPPLCQCRDDVTEYGEVSGEATLHDTAHCTTIRLHCTAPLRAL